MYVCVSIYIYMYVCIHTHNYVYIPYTLYFYVVVVIINYMHELINKQINKRRHETHKHVGKYTYIYMFIANRYVYMCIYIHTCT